MHCTGKEQHFHAALQCRVTCFTSILHINVASGALLKAVCYYTLMLDGRSK